MDKRKQILYAALDVFAKQGLDKGKIADIAKQAGIGKGTVYEYFKSKDEIFKAIELMFIGESMEQIKQLAESDDTPTEKIEALCRYSLDMHTQMGDSIFIISELWAQHVRNQLHGHDTTLFESMYVDFYKIISKILQDGVDKNEFRDMSIKGATTILLAMIDGIIWQSFIFKDAEEFNHRKREAIKAYINGIRK